MKEEYLHQIWRTKRLPMNALYLKDGRKLIVHQVGWHNHESGPDFFDGSIEIDGISWRGNIEIHIKSSDWYAHKHQLDRAYDNVILHVVYHDDVPVLIANEKIPTLELKSLLDQQHWYSYESLIKNTTWIPCATQLDQVDSIYQISQIETALVARLERKAAGFNQRFEALNRNLQQLQYEVIAQAFGMKINAMPFVELSHRMPLHFLWRENPEDRLPMLIGSAGLISEVKDLDLQKSYSQVWNFMCIKHRFESMQAASWKRKGLRPSGFPIQRISQFSQLIQVLQDDFSVFDKSVHSLLHFFDSETFLAGLTTEFKHQLIINAIVPLCWWYGNYVHNSIYKEKALQLLTQLPPEKNKIIRNWQKMQISCNSAFDSQGLLELKNEICEAKKCLSCKIGNQLLRN